MKKAILRANGRQMSLRNLIPSGAFCMAEVDAAIDLAKNGQELCRRLHRAGAAIEFRPGRETVSYYTVVGEDWCGNLHTLQVYR